MKKTLFFPLALLTVLLLSLGLTSCNSDDDPQEMTVTYNIAVTSDYTGVPSAAFNEEIKSLQDAYYDYFIADLNGDFTRQSLDVTTTNSNVATQGALVNTSLSVRTWHYNFTVQITNKNSNQIVYRANYRP